MKSDFGAERDLFAIVCDVLLLLRSEFKIKTNSFFIKIEYYWW